MAYSHYNHLHAAQIYPQPPVAIPSGNNNVFYESDSPRLRMPRSQYATQACDRCRTKKRRCDEKNPCDLCREDGALCEYSPKNPDRRIKVLERALHDARQEIVGISAQLKHMGQLVSRLDELTDRVRELEARKPTVVSDDETPPPDRWSIHNQDHYSGAHDLIELWPTVRHMLYKAKIHANAAYVTNSKQRVTGLHVTHEAPSEKKALDSTNGSKAWHEWNEQSMSNARQDDFAYSAAVKRQDLHSADDVGHRLTFLFQSYIENMHPLHPIVDLANMEKIFHESFRSLVDNAEPSNTAVVGEANELPYRPHKRRRGEGNDLIRDAPMTGQALESREAWNTALICSILALGEFCAYKISSQCSDGHPGAELGNITMVFGRSEQSQAALTADAAHSELDRVLNLQNQPLSPLAGPLNRRRSVDTQESESRVEMSNIAGMRYYTQVVKTFDRHQHGNELIHAQVALLAGLYQYQLGKIRESKSWICIAGRTCRKLLHRYDLLDKSGISHGGNPRESQQNMQRRLKGPIHDLVVLTSWSCIQLERDTLAELQCPSNSPSNCPSSGILKYQDMIPWPLRVPGAEAYSRLLPADRALESNLSSHNVLFFYTSQLWLRKRINQIQNELHGIECLDASTENLNSLLKVHHHLLDSWRKSLPATLEWNDNEPPAQDVLTARLRATYWGACFLAELPFLDYELHATPLERRINNVVSTSLDDDCRLWRKARAHLFNAIRNMPESDILTAANRCIEAAAQSARAFEGISHERIATNALDSAHTQSANVLVLTVAYSRSPLKKVIAQDDLFSLIRRTIEFVERQSLCPSTCRFDTVKLRNLLALVTSSEEFSTEITS